MKQRLSLEQTVSSPNFFFGFFTAIILLLIASIPRIITDYGIAQYARAGTNEDNSAIQLLRNLGSEQVLLRACYRQRGPVFFWGGRKSPLDIEQARQLYYRVTGESFNTNRSHKEFMPIRGDSRDRDLGGEHIGQRIDDLHIEESRLDGIIEPELGTGYVEWTIIFRNDHNWNEHEARMLISTPTGGVASRVTLWVNGEPREAAFGSKAKVRAAYQNVAVRQRRDPILVNWAGPDLLLVQCFPIQPDGGKMKVRIGISFPLETGSAGALSYRYPIIVAENFTISEQLRHSVWYEEKTSNGINSHPVIDLTTEEINSTRGSVLNPDSLLQRSFVSTHPTNSSESVTLVAKRPTGQSIKTPNAIVIDGSLAMRAHQESIAQWASRYDGTLKLFLASDDVHLFEGTGSACAEWLRQQQFVGGQDNIPALTEAIRSLQPIATADTPQNIFWFSGPQPIQLSGTEKIKQLFERRTLPIDIIACLTSRDYNALYELAPLSYSETLYLDKNGTISQPIITFEPTEDSRESVALGSSHAYRIWFANRVRRLASKAYSQQAQLRPAKFQTEIAQLANDAAKAYLVTQLSGAVVLETDQQYKENDLEAGNPNHVPTIPEAKHFALILGMCSLISIASSRVRQRSRGRQK